MIFFVKGKCRNRPGLELEGAPNAAQALLVSMMLLYLAIPDILFLWGWFVPWVAVALTLLVLLAVGRACRVVFRDAEAFARPGTARLVSLAVGVMVAALVSFYFLLRSGLLGFLPSFWDFDVLRNAMFCNLRDAAWPLVLPNGREMSYYLAGVLPPALMARLLPASGQWSVVLWTMCGMLLFLLFLSSRIALGQRSWGMRLALLTLLLALICIPLTFSGGWWLIGAVCYHTGDILGVDLSFLYPMRFPTASRALSNCAACYNSGTAALMVAALLFLPRRCAAVVLPVALSLLVPQNPLGGVALLPLACLRYVQGMKERSWSAVLWDAPLPCAMAFLSALYFLRADGQNVVTLSGIAWGWPPFWRYYIWLLAGWLLLLLPLWLTMKKDAFFCLLALCCLLSPLVFMGSMQAPGLGSNNEFALKSAPCYILLLGCCWFAAWPRIGWYRHLYMGICLALFIYITAAYFRNWGSNAYLEVDDKWNGHMNHADAFFNQSVPPCKEPLVPGILLRESGESEKHFPGCLLPKAPGCDYSRPPRTREKAVQAPLL